MTATGLEMTPLSVQFAQKAVDGTLLLQAPNTANHVTLNEAGGTVSVQWTGLGAKTFSGIRRVSFLGGNAADSLVADQAFSLPITAWGNGGDDRFVGGSAADTFFGGTGADVLDGQDGDDVLWSHSPLFPSTDEYKTRDAIYGRVGNDLVDGNRNIDSLYWNDGILYVEGTANGDRIHAIQNDGRLYIEASANSPGATPTRLNRSWILPAMFHIRGMDGNDHIASINVTLSRMQAYGGNGDDTLQSVGAYDGLFGESENDTLQGNKNIDSLYWNDGVFYVEGTAGHDKITAIQNDGRLIIEAGENRFGASVTRLSRTWPLPSSFSINGLNGDDYLDASRIFEQSNVILKGEDGKDELLGGKGNDFMSGGRGDDKFFGGEGRDTYNDDITSETLFVNGATTSDIQQGTGGTCTILAALAAGIIQGRELPQISYKGNNIYEVRLWKSLIDFKNDRIVQSPRYVNVTFDGTWYDHDAQMNGDFWALIVQRAVLANEGVQWSSASAVEHWGWYCGNAMSRIFGSVAQGKIDLVHGGPLALRDALQSGFAVTVGTRDSYTTNPYVTPKMYKLHAYAVSAVKTDATGMWLVDLYNPHGNLITVSWVELLNAVDIAVRA